MIEICIHGRGGQGAVIAGRLLAEAAHRSGRLVQAFPQFGVERRGAPVTAYVRIAEPGDAILPRCQILSPDHAIVLDPTLLAAGDVLAGLEPGGTVLVNTSRPVGSLPAPAGATVAGVDASAIALKHKLGSRAQPIVNTAILGAFASLTGIVTLDALIEAIHAALPASAEANVQAARDAHAAITRKEEEEKVA
ncbi:MAG: 2-oxoacid:acceptor oxidoreductase family protein [Armatimonadetes bacterium]|nr:2-oxoacid:acceptor oxidoreductase family protein [Armatimonadota bacterium]